MRAIETSPAGAGEFEVRSTSARCIATLRADPITLTLVR